MSPWLDHSLPRFSVQVKHQPELGLQAKSLTSKAVEAVDAPQTWKQHLNSPKKAKFLKASDSEY